MPRACIRDVEHALLRRGRLRRAVRQHRHRRLHRQDRGCGRGDLALRRHRPGLREPGRGGGHPRRRGRRRRRRRHPLRRPEGRSGHAGDAVPDELPQEPGAGDGVRPAHRRPFSGGTSGLSIGHASPEAAGAASSAWSAPATRSASTSRPAASTSTSTTPGWPAVVTRPSTSGRRGVDAPRPGTARCRRRCRSTRRSRPRRPGAVRDLSQMAPTHRPDWSTTQPGRA